MKFFMALAAVTLALGSAVVWYVGRPPATTALTPEQRAVVARAIHLGPPGDTLLATDYACPACATLAERGLPPQGETLLHVAGHASSATLHLLGVCWYRADPDAYRAGYATLYLRDVAELRAELAENVPDLDACLADAGVQTQLNAEHALALELGATATPTTWSVTGLHAATEAACDLGAACSVSKP